MANLTPRPPICLPLGSAIPIRGWSQQNLQNGQAIVGASVLRGHKVRLHLPIAGGGNNLSAPQRRVPDSQIV